MEAPTNIENLFHDEKQFIRVVYQGKLIKEREFQNCTFIKCDFSNSDFSYNKFLDCNFQECNLSLIKLNGASLNNVTFKECKILGVVFSQCQDFLFSVNFNSCVLDYASFMGRKMLKTQFVKTALKETNFTQANLGGSVFEDSNLDGAIFNRTDLSSADFTTAFNFSIDPEINTLKNARFSKDSLAGLLDKYKIKIV